MISSKPCELVILIFRSETISLIVPVSVSFLKTTKSPIFTKNKFYEKLHYFLRIQKLEQESLQMIVF